MTDATGAERYVEAFEAFSGNGAGTSPEWLRALRQRAMGDFVKLGFPTTRQEAWRFTSVREIVDRQFVLPAGSAGREGRVEEYFLPGAARLVFVNGRFAAEHSDLEGLPSGVRVESLAAAGDDEFVAKHLGQYAAADTNAFAALNTAFVYDGAFVLIPKGVVVERPIQLIYMTDAAGEPVMTYPRNLVVLESGADARVIETYAGSSGSVYLTNAVSEIVVGDNARLECYRIQRESEAAYHMATTHSVQGRSSNYALHTVPFGGAITRHDIRMVMNGEGGEGVLNGLYVIGGNQHVDHNTVIEHAVPHCDSHEYFNGVLDGRSHAVFNGRIVVQPGAQKTDSKQTNNNLLLSENARADSQPQLEIYADDVRCTHGATLGPMDDNALFYLQSRGIGADAARNILTYGFSVEILDRMNLETVRNHVEALVKERLEEGERRRQVA